MNIAYSCNEAYVQHTGISMISLFENNRDIEQINLYFIAKDISDKSIRTLEEICNKYHRKFIVIPFKEICYDLKLRDTGRHIETIYAKLFFERIKNVDKLLYLDSDTVVNASLTKLWETDLTNYYIAGVETYTVRLKKELGLSKEDVFINDGVVLMNLEQIRFNNLYRDFLSFIDSYNGSPPLLSEGTINVICKDKIKILHPKYNLMSGFLSYTDSRYYQHPFLGTYYNMSTINEAIKSPVIIHFLDGYFNRPWSNYCTHPYKNLYLYYKSLSPWKGTSLVNRKLSNRLKIIGFIVHKTPYSFFKFLQKFKF